MRASNLSTLRRSRLSPAIYGRQVGTLPQEQMKLKMITCEGNQTLARCLAEGSDFQTVWQLETGEIAAVSPSSPRASGSLLTTLSKVPRRSTLTSTPTPSRRALPIKI